MSSHEVEGQERHPDVLDSLEPQVRGRVPADKPRRSRRPLAPVPPAAREAGEAPPSKVWKWVVVGGIVVVGCVAALAIAGVFGLSSFLKEMTFPVGPNSSPDPQEAYQGVWWAADGAYAVIQGVGEDRVPRVVVWRRSSDTTEALPGYRVVAVEPHAARAWVVPDGKPLPQTPSEDWHAPNVAGDGSDAPNPDLRLLALDSAGLTPVSAPLAWGDWTDASGVSAKLSGDASVGVLPSTLSFQAKDGSVVRASIPGVGTFTPLGFSPSGKYFALFPATRAEGASIGSDTADALTIVSARTGQVVAQANTDPSKGASGDTNASWDATRDVIYFDDVLPDATDSGPYEEPTLRALSVDGTQADAPQKFGWKVPAEVAKASEGRLLGATASGPLWALSTDDGTHVYRVTASGLVRQPDPSQELFGESTSLDPSGALLVFGQTDESTLQLVLVDATGNRADKLLLQQAVLWQPPEVHD